MINGFHSDPSVVKAVRRPIADIAVRYDERFHIGIEADDRTITARAVIGGLVQEWTHPVDGGRVGSLDCMR